MELWVIVFSILILAESNEGTNKIWKASDFSFGKASNWDKNRVPCITDSAVFPYNMEHIVELPSESTINRIVLPFNGELILPRDGFVTISGRTIERSCPGEDIKFKMAKVPRWLDYRNWVYESEAVPHIERIPCINDIAIFPKASIVVMMPPVTVVVSGVVISQVFYGAKSWIELLKTDEGTRIFLREEGSTGVVIQQNNMEKSNPECGTYPLKRFICDFPCPVQLPCFYPVTPLGHCCPICGAYILYDFDHQNFNLSLLNDGIKKYFSETEDNLDWWASKVLGYVQIVLLEKGPYYAAVHKSASSLNEFLLSRPKEFNVSTISVHLAGVEYRPMSVGLKFAIMIGTFIGALVFLTCLVAYYHQEEKWDLASFLRQFEFRNFRGKKFLFARFENATGEVELTSEDSQELAVEAIRAFDNPMYSKKDDRVVIQENPVYSEILDTEENKVLVGVSDSDITSFDLAGTVELLCNIPEDSN